MGAAVVVVLDCPFKGHSEVLLDSITGLGEANRETASLCISRESGQISKHKHDASKYEGEREGGGAQLNVPSSRTVCLYSE